MNRRISLPAAAIAFAALLVLSVTAFAQETTRRSLSGRIGGEGDPGLLEPNPAFASSPSPEGMAVTTDRGYLFVVRGGRLYKVDETSLAVVATGHLDGQTPERRSRPGVHRKRATSTHAKEADR